MSQVQVSAVQQANGAAPVVSAHVPQQIALSGQHYIQLALAPSDFVATARATAEKREGS